MKTLLKKNLKKIIIYSSVLIILIISMCFSAVISKTFTKIISNKKHIIVNDKMIVHFINVDQADAVAINFPNGEIALIDTGSLYSANNLISYLNSNVIPFGNGCIDYLFFSHADSDHTGGMSSLLYNYKVKNIVRPRQYASFESLSSVFDSYFINDDFTNTMTMVYSEVENGANLIKAENLINFEIGNVKLDIFYPEIIVEDSNNFSYFIKVEYKGNSLLFTGDADATLEQELIKDYAGRVDCDILKVGHHGSSTSSSIEFLDCVSPTYAVISVGKNNWGHPTSDVINNLKQSGVDKILRTDIEGNIAFSIDNDIRLFTGEYYISLITFSYQELAWCVVFVLMCYGGYWCCVNFEPLIKSKIKHN